MTRYINYKAGKEVETIDQLDSKDFTKFSEFRKELKRLCVEHNTAHFGHCYISSRSTKDWRNR